MKIILSNGQMRAADSATIAAGTPSEELMARAGAAIAQEVERAYRERKAHSVLVVCGTGNNGGDGYVCARLLSERLGGVSVYAVEGRFSADCLRERQRYNGRYSRHICGDIIVDCLFGTGLARAVEGDYARIIEEINASGAYVISADIPSGLSGDNGRVMGTCVRADRTVAIAYLKLGHALADGTDMCGEVTVKDIGITAIQHSVGCAEDADIAAFFPPRRRNTNKGSFGSCQLVAGKCYAGAAVLSLSAALLSGCGYVRAVADEHAKYALVGQYPQVIYDDGVNLSVGAIACGMGMGCSRETYELTRYLLGNYGGKLILDADSLNSLSEYGKDCLKGAKCGVLITPHPLEFSRLTGKSVAEISDDPVGCARQFAAEYGVTVHLKGCVTITTDREKSVLVTRGSSVLARAGSGDMLSGLMAGFAARGVGLFDSAVCAQYVLGGAAELAGEQCGEYCATAQDVIKNIKTFVKSLTEKCGK